MKKRFSFPWTAALAVAALLNIGVLAAAIAATVQF